MSNPWPVYSHGAVSSDAASGYGYPSPRSLPPRTSSQSPSPRTPPSAGYGDPNWGRPAPSMSGARPSASAASRYNRRPSPSQQFRPAPSGSPAPSIRSRPSMDSYQGSNMSPQMSDEQWPLPPRALVQVPRPNSPKRPPPSRPQRTEYAGPRQQKQRPPPSQQYPYPPAQRPQQSHRGNARRPADAYRGPPRQQYPTQGHPQQARYQRQPYPGPSNSSSGYSEFSQGSYYQHQQPLPPPQRPIPGPPATARRGMLNLQHQKPAQVHSIAEEGESTRGSMLSVGMAGGNLARASYASSNAIPGYYTEDHSQHYSNNEASSPYQLDSPADADTLGGGTTTGDEDFYTPPTEREERRQNLFDQQLSRGLEERRQDQFQQQQQQQQQQSQHLMPAETLQPSRRGSSLFDREAQDSSPEPTFPIRQASLGKKSKPTLTTVTRKDSLSKFSAPLPEQHEEDEELTAPPPMSFFEDETPDQPDDSMRFFEGAGAALSSNLSRHMSIGKGGADDDDSDDGNDQTSPTFALKTEDDENEHEQVGSTTPTFAFEVDDDDEDEEEARDVLPAETTSPRSGVRNSRPSTQRYTTASEFGEISGAAALASALRRDFMESTGQISARSSLNVDTIQRRSVIDRTSQPPAPPPQAHLSNDSSRDGIVVLDGMVDHTVEPETTVEEATSPTSPTIPTTTTPIVISSGLLTVADSQQQQQEQQSEQVIKRMPSRELLNAAVPKEQQRRSRPRSPLAPTTTDPIVERLVSDLERDGGISAQEASSWRNPAAAPPMVTVEGPEQQGQPQQPAIDYFSPAAPATATVAAAVGGALLALPTADKNRVSRLGGSRPTSAASWRSLGGSGGKHKSGLLTPPRASFHAGGGGGNAGANGDESRGSLTSLSDLIRRATKVANNLDKGRTASRLGMNWFLDGSNNGSVMDVNEKERYLNGDNGQSQNVRRSGVSFSDILSAFPDPNANGFDRAQQVRHSQILGSDSDAGEAADARRRAEMLNKRSRARCCGMPRWVFILVMVLVALLVIAAVLVPVFLVIMPQKH